MSRNFLDRYRLRALIVELIELDQDETPLEDRNIDWLIDRYFEHILPRSLDNRIITDPSLDPEILLEPRHPRHVSRAEIRGYFASQAEWLLANQLASSSISTNVKLVEIRQWISFCLQVRTEVADAKRNGIKWGVPHKTGIYTSNNSLNLPQSLAKYGQTESFWAKKLEHVNTQRKAGKAKPSKVSFNFSPLYRTLIVLSVEVYPPSLGYLLKSQSLLLVNSSTTRISLRHLRMPHQMVKINQPIRLPTYPTSAINLQRSPMVASSGTVQVVITTLIF